MRRKGADIFKHLSPTREEDLSVSHWLLQELKAVLNDEAGQAFSEYFVVTLTCVVGISASFWLLDKTVGPYYTAVVRWVTLPIP